MSNDSNSGQKKLQTLFEKLYANQASSTEKTLEFIKISKELETSKEEIENLYNNFLFEKWAGEKWFNPNNWLLKCRDNLSIFKQLTKVAFGLSLFLAFFQACNAFQDYSESNELKEESNRLAREEAIRSAWRSLQTPEDEQYAGYGRGEALQLLASKGIPLDGIELNGVNLNLLILSPDHLKSIQLIKVNSTKKNEQEFDAEIDFDAG